MSLTLSLESLGQYCDEQASRTNQLISDGFLTSTPPDLNERVEFRNSLRMSSLPQLPDMTPNRLHAILAKYSASPPLPTQAHPPCRPLCS